MEDSSSRTVDFCIEDITGSVDMIHNQESLTKDKREHSSVNRQRGLPSSPESVVQ
jgi:hypothetical protein